MTSSNSLWLEMQASAHGGNLPRLRTQLSQWQSQNINTSISQDSLGFKTSASEREEVQRVLNLPYPPSRHREPEDIDPHLLHAQSVDDPGREDESG